MRGAGRGIGAALAALLTLPQPAAGAGVAGPSPARVAVIIDDMGNRRADGERALALPGPVTYAFLPGTPATPALARRAHRAGKEVMLHQPMEPVAGLALGPGGITLHMGREAVRRQLARNLAAVPHAAGVNNHMGSLITRHPGHMTWLMEALRERGDLYYVDSRTTPRSVGERMAREVGVPTARRDVFLDNERAGDAIARQFERLVAQARRDGRAVGIAHPHPQTVDALDRLLPTLAARGVRLVPVSALIHGAEAEARNPWHASLSPSPTVSKSSRPSPSSTCSGAPASTCGPPASKVAR